MPETLTHIDSARSALREIRTWAEESQNSFGSRTTRWLRDIAGQGLDADEWQTIDTAPVGVPVMVVGGQHRYPRAVRNTGHGWLGNPTHWRPMPELPGADS